MSPKHDTYKSLCLEQALKSPLHYRHGCIIVRGGKIIGKGYNQSRPGFNGGALKNGRMPSANLNPDAKQKQKKKKQKSKHIPQPDQLGGGGPSANSPLSMHSEMMAIRSALSLSAHENGSSARGTAWVAGGGLNRLHIHSGEGHNKIPNESKERENVKNEKGKKGNEKKGQGDRYGGHHGTQSQYHDDGGNVLDGPPEATEKTRTISATMADSPSVAARGTSPPNAVRTPKNSECNPQSRKSPRPTHDSRKPLQHLSTAQPILVPVARTAAKSSRLTDRRLDSRVKGADIYVARLAWKRAESPSPQPKHSRGPRHCSTPDSSGSSTDGGKEAEASSSPSRSLYNELSPLSQSCSPTYSPSPSPPPAAPASVSSKSAPLLSATSSRPCYRCISYMHGAGIRRVFWTNSDGEWEGGKVREMVEALEFAGGSAAGAGKREVEGTGKGMGMGMGPGTGGMGMFVTKHEVLMLRRREMGGA